MYNKAIPKIRIVTEAVTANVLPKIYLIVAMVILTQYKLYKSPVNYGRHSKKLNSSARRFPQTNFQSLYPKYRKKISRAPVAVMWRLLAPQGCDGCVRKSIWRVEQSLIDQSEQKDFFVFIGQSDATLPNQRSD